MKNLFKKFKKMFKKTKKVSKKRSKRSITKKKGVKFMVTVNLELGENLKDVAKKLRELADQLDPMDKACPPKDIEDQIEDAKKRVVNLVPKKTIVSKKEKVKKEEIETFEESEIGDTDLLDAETEVEVESTEVETFDDADDSDNSEDNSLSLTDDIIPACKEFAKKNGEKGRSNIAAMLKELKVNSIHDLKPENYEKFLNKLNGKK
jgi:hypothetical protein